MKKYNMVTVDEYLKVLDSSKLSLKDVDTMISVEKYLTEVVSKRNEKVVNE